MNQQTMLTDGEIAEIADKVLRREFKGLGLEHLDIRSESAREIVRGHAAARQS